MKSTMGKERADTANKGTDGKIVKEVGSIIISVCLL